MFRIIGHLPLTIFVFAMVILYTYIKNYRRIIYMKKAIVYYSITGTCRNTATAMAQRWGADIIELKVKNKPNTKSVFGFMKVGFKSSTRGDLILAGDINADVAPYDQVNIIAPMRAGKSDPAINACLKVIDFTNKEVGIFSVQADPGFSKSEAMLDSMAERIEARGGKIVFRQALAGASPNKTRTLEEMQAQINDIFQDVR